MEFHEAANIFPLMSDEEYRALVLDIQEHGQREPIWVFEDKIIDGRNRYRACIELGITPNVQEWDGQGLLISFIVSLNLHRRHLTSSQKAVVALEAMPWFAKEAAQRVGGRPRQGDEKPPQFFGEVSEQGKHANESGERAAKLVGTNRQYIADARKIRDAAPDLIPVIRDGHLSVPDGKRVSRLPEEYREAIIAKASAGEDFKDILKQEKDDRARFLDAPMKALRKDLEFVMWPLALKGIYELVVQGPGVSVQRLLGYWEMERKRAILSMLHEIQPVLDEMTRTLEKELSGYDDFDPNEIAEYLRKQMGE